MKKKFALAAILLSATWITSMAQQPGSGVNGSSNGNIDTTTNGPITDNSPVLDKAPAAPDGAPDVTNTPSAVPSTPATATDTSSNTPSTVSASTGPGLVDGVVENTDPDRIAAIQEHARQLEAKRSNYDAYEPTAAGKRNKHKHGGKPHAPKNNKAPTSPEPTATLQ